MASHRIQSKLLAAPSPLGSVLQSKLLQPLELTEDAFLQGDSYQISSFPCMQAISPLRERAISPLPLEPG